MTGSVPKTRFPLAAGMALLLATGSVLAAPVPLPTELPVRAPDLQALERALAPELGRFTAVEVLARVRVYPDSENRLEAEGDPSIAKTYYTEPFLRVDGSADRVGGQEIATRLLFLVDELDRLMASLGVTNERERIAHLGLQELERLQQVYEELVASGRLDRSPALDRYLEDDNRFQEAIAAISERIASRVARLSDTERAALAAAFVSAAEVLGMEIPYLDLGLASLDPAAFITKYYPRIRATIARQIFGVTHVTYLAGLRATEREVLGAFLQRRPDVRLVQMPLHQLGVQAAAQTVRRDVLGGPILIHGANTATGGVCGSLDSCLVVLEYTEIGARTAALSTAGAVAMPITFRGQQALAPDAHEACTFSPQAVADTAPLWLDEILLYPSQLLRSLVQESPCPAGGSPGLVQAAAVLAGYLAAFTGRIQLGSTMRSAAQSRIERLLGDTGAAELARQMGSFFAAVKLAGEDDLPHLAGVLANTGASWIVPRVPLDLLRGLAMSARPAPRVELPLDGDPRVCWKRSRTGERVLAACRAGLGRPFETQAEAARLLEERYCSPEMSLPACLRRVEDQPPGAGGFYELP